MREAFLRDAAGPLVWAHRGASARAPENTMAAFELAAEERADGIELDVRLAGSGEVVVHHDATLDRLAGRPGRVAEMSWSELRTVEVRGERIPLLDDVLELARDVGLRVNIEIKGDVPDRRAVAHAVAAVLMRHGPHLASCILVSSFRPEILLAFHLRLTAVARAFLFDHDNTGARRADALLRLLGPEGAHPQKQLCDATHVAGWHRRGMFVAAWTADDPAELRRLDLAGVDGIITNDPARARALCRSRPNGADPRCSPGRQGL